MTCPHCQVEVPPDARFCPGCGHALSSTCVHCGTANAAVHRFCKGCGAPLPVAPASREEADPSRAPLTYTPRHLAEKILVSKSALEGERKQVTVLFCDIVESTRLAARLDAEEMHALMDKILRLMAEAVHRYQGTVNQFLGDGLMALFGAPVAVEDHALRAVQAALAIQETVGGYSELLKRERALEVRLRLGLNTGLVVVGRIGDDLRMDYTAVGDTTNLAARMQALAEPGTILITESTHRATAGHIRVEPLGPLQVKGRSEPVTTYRVTGRQPTRSRLEIAAERGLTPLVGRAEELGLLKDRLAHARAGHGQAVGIIGEAGAGKSRLLYEFRRSLADEPLTWLVGHCVAYGQGTPYLPVQEILAASFDIQETDNPLQVRQKMLQGLREVDPGLETALPFLGELFGLPIDDERLRALEPKDKRQRLFEAVRALTIARSRRRPLVLIVEDLHWIDRSSEELIARLIDSVPAAALLLVLTHRPGHAVRWADKTYYTQIALDLLSEPEAGSMIASLLGTRHTPSDLASTLWQKSEGNPLFVEEILRSLLDARLLVRSNGEVRWTAGPAVDLPVTVQDIVRARIDGLEESVKRTVQTAAVVGREFGLGLLERLTEEPSRLGADLETLKHLELVHEIRFFPELEYAFKHAVTQEVVYESLLGPRRRALHGFVGQALEELYRDRLDEQAPLLAHHYGRSADPEKAITHALRAGDRAARLYASADARAYYERALAMLRERPASADRQRTQIEVVLKLAGVATTREDIARDRENLEWARGLAEALNDSSARARVLYWLGRLHYVLGAFAASIDYARQSLEIADALGDETLSAPSVNLIGRVYWNQNEFLRAIEMLERSVEQMRRLGNTAEAATAASAAGFALGCMGEFERAMGYADLGVQLARETHDPLAESAARQQRAFVREYRGHLTEALEEYVEARRIATGVGDRFRLYIIDILEGRARTYAGDLKEGRARLEAAGAFARQIGTKFFVATQRISLAECLLALGSADAAVTCCEEAVALSDETGEKLAQARARRVLAEASVSRDPSPASLEAAERGLRETLPILQEIGARPELARTYVVLAGVLRAKGDETAARDLTERARAMFVEMDLRWDLERLPPAAG